MKNDKFTFWDDLPWIELGNGVRRKIMAYTDEIMQVYVQFDKGAVGAMHHHPHIQLTYVLSGVFEFTIDGETKIVKAGDTLLKQPDVEHGCVCLEAGVLLDTFTPMRADFL